MARKFYLDETDPIDQNNGSAQQKPKPVKQKGNFVGIKENDTTKKYDKAFNTYKASNPNVTLGGKVIPMSSFGNYFKQLGWLESSLDPNATNGTYSGYWAQRNAGGKPFADQFKSLIGHHNRMLKDMVVEDYEAARAKGFNDAEIMAKYHNQGRRSFDYYHNNRDHTDGNGTKISQYGNGMSPISVLPSLVTQHALPGDYYILKDGQSLGSIENRVRVKGVNPANNIPYLLKVNGEKYNGRRKITVVDKKDKQGKNPRTIAINKKYDPKNDSVVNILSRVGDTIYFRK